MARGSLGGLDQVRGERSLVLVDTVTMTRRGFVAGYPVMGIAVASVIPMVGAGVSPARRLAFALANAAIYTPAVGALLVAWRRDMLCCIRFQQWTMLVANAGLGAVWGVIPVWFDIGADRSTWMLVLAIVFGLSGLNVIGYSSLPGGVALTLWPVMVPLLLSLASSGVEHARSIMSAVAAYLIMVTFYGALNGRQLRQSSVLRHRNSALAERLTNQAHHDGLTRLLNGHGLLSRLALPNDGSARVLLFVDLDRFKAVNDTYGHSIGDEVLRTAAARLRECCRRDDAVARLGGDEFVVVTSGGLDGAMATALSNRIVARLREPMEVGAIRIALGVSVGVACSTDVTGDPLELLSAADVAMYEAKTTRASVRDFDAQLARRTSERRDTEQALRAALESEGELYVVGQPLVDIRSERVTGVEMLARWERPGVGPVSPSDFIPVAERSDLIIDFDRWVAGPGRANVGRMVADPGHEPPRTRCQHLWRPSRGRGSDQRRVGHDRSSRHRPFSPRNRDHRDTPSPAIWMTPVRRWRRCAMPASAL